MNEFGAGDIQVTLDHPPDRPKYMLSIPAKQVHPKIRKIFKELKHLTLFFFIWIFFTIKKNLKEGKKAGKSIEILTI